MDPQTAINSIQLAGEARMTLAFALNWLGRPRVALREIDTAIRDLRGVERARAHASTPPRAHGSDERSRPGRDPRGSQPRRLQQGGGTGVNPLG